MVDRPIIDAVDRVQERENRSKNRRTAAIVAVGVGLILGLGVNAFVSYLGVTRNDEAIEAAENAAQAAKEYSRGNRCVVQRVNFISRMMLAQLDPSLPPPPRKPACGVFRPGIRMIPDASRPPSAGDDGSSESDPPAQPSRDPEPQPSQRPRPEPEPDPRPKPRPDDDVCVGADPLPRVCVRP